MRQSIRDQRAVSAPCVRVVPWRTLVLSARTRQAVDRLAGEILASEPAIGAIDAFGPLVFKGCGPQPKILFGDSGEIPLLSEASYNRLDYRMGFLAGEGDLMVVSGARNAAFEDYQKSVLGLAALDYMGVPARFDGRSRAATPACLRDEEVLARLSRFAAGQGGTTLFAFLTTGTVWALAARLAAETGCRIGVAGPPPLMSRRANDKLWFGQIVSSLLGAGALPEKRCAHGWSALVRHVGDLARTRERLVIKVPDSAGSAGNWPVDCAAVRGLGPKGLSRHLRDLVPVHMAKAPFPVAVEVWDVDAVTSPSVQVWIPDREDGYPVVEGIFEQMLIGEEGEFAGAAMARLPADIETLLTEQAFALACLFQRLGYFGRCSFDSVVAGGNSGDMQVHWIECNARWGGVSIPMSFANNTGRTESYAVIQCGRMSSRPRPVESAIDIAGVRSKPGGDVVLLSPDVVEAGTGCHFMAFGATPERALQHARQVVQRLKGPD